MATYTGKTTTVHGINIHYLDEGSGPPLLLLHGGGPAASGGAHYVKNIGPLSQRFRVIAPDFPNFGASERVAVSESNTVINARTADGLLDALGIASANVMGYSMGGSASMKLAAEYPARVQRVVLLGGGSSLPSPLGVLPPEGARAMQEFGRNPTRENFERSQRLFVYDPACIDSALMDALWAAEQQADPVPPPAAPPPRDDLFPDLAKIKAETLIVRGRDDRLAPLDQGLVALAGIANARLHVFSRCGHWIQYEKAEELHRLLESFL